MSFESKGTWRYFMTMATLIVAGEAIFLLPFVMIRIFRPTVLKVFDITNLQLGTAFSFYGIVAMASYFLGGPLADRYPARRLMAVALFMTAIGGIVFLNIPSLGILTWIYGFWGMTTILFFWAALIRATREWGGTSGQGKAYGILDGGRGLFAAILASASVVVFANLLPTDVNTANLEELTIALQRVILIYMCMVGVTAILVLIFIPEKSSVGSRMNKLTVAGVKQAMQQPQIWLQAAIVVCAYVGYKSTDDFSLYASDAFGYDDVEAAQLGTLAFWVRPFAAVIIGFIADRLMASWMVIVSFAIMVFGSLMIASGFMEAGFAVMLSISVIFICIGANGLRGIYFALLEEGNIPLHITGSAIGIVSVVGFTPDIFMGPLMGYLVDQSPGPEGHQHFFGVVALFGLVGLLAGIGFRWVIFREKSTLIN